MAGHRATRPVARPWSGLAERGRKRARSVLHRAREVREIPCMERALMLLQMGHSWVGWRGAAT